MVPEGGPETGPSFEPKAGLRPTRRMRPGTDVAISSLMFARKWENLSCIMDTQMQRQLPAAEWPEAKATRHKQRNKAAPSLAPQPHPSSAGARGWGARAHRSRPGPEAGCRLPGFRVRRRRPLRRPPEAFLALAPAQPRHLRHLQQARVAENRPLAPGQLREHELASEARPSPPPQPHSTRVRGDGRGSRRPQVRGRSHGHETAL